MNSFQRGKSPLSIAVSKSRPLLSRSLATRASASASVRFAMPCWVRKWNLTQMRSFAALIIENVWLPYKFIWRKLFGMPRSDIVIVTWCKASGSNVQKSQLLSALRRPGRGSRLIAWLRSEERIAEEEHRRVVPDDVPIAFFGVELQRGAAYVALRVRGAALTGNGGEAHEHWRLLADRAEDLRLGEAGDVVRHREGAVGAPAFGVHAALGDHLTVEMRHLLEQPDVLQQRGAARTGSHDVCVVGHRCAGGVGETLRCGHDKFSLGGMVEGYE